MCVCVCVFPSKVTQLNHGQLPHNWLETNKLKIILETPNLLPWSLLGHVIRSHRTYDCRQYLHSTTFHHSRYQENKSFFPNCPLHMRQLFLLIGSFQSLVLWGIWCSEGYDSHQRASHLCIPFSATSQANAWSPCMENGVYGYIMDLLQVLL